MRKVLVFFSVLCSFFLFSCEKETGYGDFIISISNTSNDRVQLIPRIDGKDQGILIIQPNYSPSWSVTSPCSDKITAAQLENVRIFNYVASGKHTFELLDYTTGHAYYSFDFEIRGSNCTYQPLTW
jgi:hypothetical protein